MKEKFIWKCCSLVFFTSEKKFSAFEVVHVTFLEKPLCYVLLHGYRSIFFGRNF